MRSIVAWLREYFLSLNKRLFLLTSLVVALLIALNYTIGIERSIVHSPNLATSIAGFFFLYLFAFSFAYWLQSVFRRDIATRPSFFALLLLGPAIFAVKISCPVGRLVFGNPTAPWRKYWAQVADWPIKCLGVLAGITVIWTIFGYSRPIAGWKIRGFSYRPYLLLLACMVPLIAFAGTQPDFLAMYPRLTRIAYIYPYVSSPNGVNLLYELSYGTDFLTVETFFRGFLVLAFARYAGKNAILPMAVFYCCIHFGKPMFECITSYPGGIILGVIVYHTRSIWGGLAVHLGIAWLMEVAGYVGNHLH